MKSVANTRPDARSDHTLRPLTCELSCLKNCDGSALWKAGGTSVLAAIHGPIAPRQAHHEHHEHCRIQVIFKSGSIAQHGTYEREWEGWLARILTACCLTELYPRCILSVTLQIESSDGSVLAAALHAAVSALMDAGVELRTLPVAVTCLLLVGSSNDFSQRIRLDPCHAEEQSDDAAVLVLVLDGCSAETQLLACHTPTADVQQSIPSVLQCCEIAFQARAAITAFWRLAMESKVQREAQTLWSS